MHLTTHAGDAGLISSADLARLLDISVPTLKRWVVTGKVPGPSVVRKNLHLWRLADVQALVDRVRRMAPPAVDRLGGPLAL